MTDPCESCLRWSECNGVDIDNCPLWRDRLAAQYGEIAAMDLSSLEDKTESGLFEED